MSAKAVKIGDEWMDGMQVGRAAAIGEWRMRKEIDDPEFRRLIWRLQAKKYWASKDPGRKAAIREYRKLWAINNRDRYRAAINKSKANGRKAGATWYKRQLAAKRRKFAELTAQRRREDIHECIECGAQWCIAIGRIPTRPPKYCSLSCRGKVAYRRRKAKP